MDDEGQSSPPQEDSGPSESGTEGSGGAAEISRRVAAILDAVEREAQKQREEARAEAAAYLERATRTADELVADRKRRISELSDELVRKTEAVVSRLDDAAPVQQGFESLVRALGDAAQRLSDEALVASHRRPAVLTPPRARATAAPVLPGSSDSRPPHSLRPASQSPLRPVPRIPSATAPRRPSPGPPLSRTPRGRRRRPAGRPRFRRAKSTMRAPSTIRAVATRLAATERPARRSATTSIARSGWRMPPRSSTRSSEPAPAPTRSLHGPRARADAAGEPRLSRSQSRTGATPSTREGVSMPQAPDLAAAIGDLDRATRNFSRRFGEAADASPAAASGRPGQRG